VRAGKMLTGQSILIEGDRIKHVGANLRPPDGARIIDLSGSTVLPTIPNRTEKSNVGTNHSRESASGRERRSASSITTTSV
jgi:dihydroorotase-like cyclic amidohydrolase